MNFTYCFPTMEGKRAGQLIEDTDLLLGIYDLNQMLSSNFGMSEDDRLILHLLEGQ